ncbi:unnamed protein product [Rhizophagus irregularis]|nr:unnamed protein product [Rhizophagus irregularis]
MAHIDGILNDENKLKISGLTVEEASKEQDHNISHVHHLHHILNLHDFFLLFPVIICLNSLFLPSNPPKKHICVIIEQPDATRIENLTAGIAGIQFQVEEEEDEDKAMILWPT